MCDLCNPDSTHERHRIENFAGDLKKLAAFYELVSRGEIKPHTDEYKKKDYLARHVIRELVYEWL